MTESIGCPIGKPCATSQDRIIIERER